MNILVVLGHPSRESFNFAIADTACETLRDHDHEVYFHDLYRERFDPALPKEEIPRIGGNETRLLPGTAARFPLRTAL